MPQVRHDKQRGCGWRKAGGLYLVAPATGSPCGALPIPLTRCPCCDAGIKPSRGWTWITVEPLLAPAVALCGKYGHLVEPKPFTADSCAKCPANSIRGRHGLLWIGEQFYPTPDDWRREVREQGISRRISALPNEFVLGTHWVLVAHRKAIRNAQDGTYTPGVFQMFKPQAVEYVVRGNESAAQLAALEKRGVTPVEVKRDGGLFDGQPDVAGE